MKKYLLILFLFIFNTSIGQSFLSPITLYSPNNLSEKIDRNIIIETSQIKIVTYITQGKNIQTFNIIGVEEVQYRDIGLATLYICTSLDGHFITQIIVPKRKPVEFIDAIQPSQIGEAKRHYRFILDADSNKLM